MAEFPESWRDLHVILAHDWLTGMRGGERVLEVLCRAFPNATIVTLLHNHRAVSRTINAHRIRTSWLQHVPGIMRFYRYFLPFFPVTIEHMPVPEANLLISTSHCVAKGIRSRGGTRHLCYCFTPMRYAWTFHQEYFGGRSLKRLAAEPVLRRLREWDRETSARVDHFVAISRHVQDRIAEYYRRESDIVYPPVDTERLTPGSQAREGFDLIVSALVPYKRVDLAVKAYNRLGYPLKVAGTGTELPGLRRLAGPNVEILGWQPDEQVRDLYRRCRLLVFPGEEDFGIVPLEAQACGTPVVAYARGGAVESVREHVSGVFFDQQTEASLIDGVQRGAAARWDRAAIRANAERFSTQTFIDGLARSITRCLK